MATIPSQQVRDSFMGRLNFTNNISHFFVYNTNMGNDKSGSDGLIKSGESGPTFLNVVPPAPQTPNETQPPENTKSTEISVLKTYRRP